MLKNYFDQYTLLFNERSYKLRKLETYMYNIRKILNHPRNRLHWDIYENQILMQSTLRPRQDMHNAKMTTSSGPINKL